jgi:hypothetical protein
MAISPGTNFGRNGANMSSMECPMYIGGGWVATPDKQTIELPYDGTSVATVYHASAREVEMAIAAASAAAPVMRETTRDDSVPGSGIMQLCASRKGRCRDNGGLHYFDVLAAHLFRLRTTTAPYII